MSRASVSTPATPPNTATCSLNGNALKSLSEMSGAVTHAVWYFATNRDVLPDRASTAAATSAP